MFQENKQQFGQEELEGNNPEKYIYDKFGFEAGLAFKIEGEVDENGEQIDADIYWVRFPRPDVTDGLSVEGKIYAPKSSNGNLIIFAPGSPGGDSGSFERKHANALVKAGNTFITLRHNGQGIGAEKSQIVFNAPQRIEQMEASGESYLGQNTESDKVHGYTWLDQAGEPIAPIIACQDKFDRIRLIGHSFGATSMFYSLGELTKTNPEIIEKVDKVISLAGYLGKDEITQDNFWHGLKVDFDTLVDAELADAIEDKVNLVTDRNEFANSLKLFAKQMEKLNLPEEIGQILVTSPYDAVIAMPVIKYSREEDGKEFVQAYDYPGHVKKSLIIEDSTQPEKKTHKMLGIKPETLLRLLEMQLSSHSSHFVKVKEKTTKEEREK